MRSIKILLFITVALSVRSQEVDLFHFQGRMIDIYGEVIEYAHIINLSRSTGVISDRSGRFAILAREGDSIMITHLTHITRFLSARKPPDELFVDEVVLLPRVFELSELIIRPLPRNRAEFRHDFKNLRLPPPPEPVDIRMPHISTLVYTGPEHGVGIVIKGPFQAFYDQFSREARQRRKLESELAKEFVAKQVAGRFNPQLIKRATGLSNEEEINRFMEFCNFDPSFILRVSDYELVTAILICYERYARVFPNHSQ